MIVHKRYWIYLKFDELEISSTIEIEGRTKPNFSFVPHAIYGVLMRVFPLIDEI